MTDLTKIATCELTAELEKREAVQTIWVEPYTPFEISVGGEKQETEMKEGPCLIYVVWD